MTTESLLTKVPENTSILQPTKYTFIFPNLPFARYFCQTISLPGISTSAVAVPTPFVTTYRHGDTLVFEDFQINAIIDEDLRVWEETYKWLVGLTKPTQFPEYLRAKDKNADLYYDAILTINTNANLPNMRIKFKNCHPVALGSVQFNTADSATTIPTADITFRYDYFEFERI